MKCCTKCMVFKDESSFDKDRSHIDGLRSWCKECRNEQWFANREENLIKKRAVYIKHRDKNLERAKHYYETADKEEMKKKRREYEDRLEVRRRIRNYWKFRRDTEPIIRLNNSMRAGVYNSIKKNKNGAGWQDIVGYSTDDLKTHLEKLFKPGMTWENYGEWEIDHVVPLSFFNFTSKADHGFRKAWALNNLQPLWIFDNRSKGGTNRLDAMEVVNEAFL